MPMKKLLVMAMLLGSTLAFAKSSHVHSKQEQRTYYELVKHQLDEGKITIKEAQKMWLKYIKCCK
jgi:hypothetical protein